jgi:metal-sulfur cluster biosynthetic enzyme
MSTEPEPSVVWEIESTSPDKGIKLRQALREVVDPELGLSVVELGLIRQAAIKDDGVHLTMIMTTPFCPYGPALLEMTRAKAEAAIEMPTTIEMGMQMWDPSMMEEGAGAAWGFF